MIGDRAFIGCTGLNSVTIGNGVTEIGWFAFADCTGLSSITIGQSVATTAVWSFLLGCTGLTAIEVSPQNPVFSSVDGALFDKSGTTLYRVPSNRSGAYQVPGTVVAIGDGAFEGCVALTSIAVPASVTSIALASIVELPALARIEVDSANQAYSSLDGVLFNKDRTELIRYPAPIAGAYSIPAGVTSIGGAFRGCAGLTSISIPAGVTSIGGGAFAGCTGLTSVTLPAGVTEIGEGLFRGCTALTSVSIPGVATSIGDYAFEDCAGLTSVSIPNSVTKIGYAAFRRCTGLASITIGRGVTAIQIEAFTGCTGLTGFTVDALNSTYRSIDGALYYKSPLGLIRVPARKAGSYSIPNGVTVIGRGAFDGCAELTSVSIPASTNVDDTFLGCRKLTAINVDPQNQRFSSIDGVLYDRVGIRLIRFPAGRTGTCTVPARVLNLETGAFESCSGLHSILYLGDSPGAAPSSVDVASGFTVYYLRGSFGFTSPTWLGFPSVMIDRAVHPAAEWLLGYGLPYNAGLQDDPNGDGVSLLMAYALNLNPNLNLHSSLPVPVLGPQDLSLSFHGIRPGITYSAETSTDLMHWTTDGVILSAPGPDGRRTASIPRDGSARYLRLTVGQ
jgi:hypothetical protein